MLWRIGTLKIRSSMEKEEDPEAFLGDEAILGHDDVDEELREQILAEEIEFEDLLAHEMDPPLC